MQQEPGQDHRAKYVEYDTGRRPPRLPVGDLRPLVLCDEREVLVPSSQVDAVADELCRRLDGVEVPEPDAQEDFARIVVRGRESPRQALEELRETAREVWGGWTPRFSHRYPLAPFPLHGDGIEGQPVTFGSPRTGDAIDQGWGLRPADEAFAPRSDSDAGAGVTIGVIDTALYHHSWFQGAYLAEPGDMGEPPPDPDLDSADWLWAQTGHSTFITGLILRQAPGAVVRTAKVLNERGFAHSNLVAREIDRMRERQVDILNLSLGCYTADDEPPADIASALARLDADTVVVSCAGNHGSPKPFFPAALPDVLAVGAATTVNGTDALDIAPFSNYGPWVDVAVPAVDVLSTFLVGDGPKKPQTLCGRDPDDFDGWAYWTGTSFAAPQLAGAIAARMTTDQVSARVAKQRLLQSAPARHGARIRRVLDTRMGGDPHLHNG